MLMELKVALLVPLLASALNPVSQRCSFNFS